MTRRTVDELMRDLRATLQELTALDPAALSDLEVTESVASAFGAQAMLDPFTTTVVGEAETRRRSERRTCGT